jgi:hypothetical protein
MVCRAVRGLRRGTDRDVFFPTHPAHGEATNDCGLAIESGSLLRPAGNTRV